MLTFTKTIRFKLTAWYAASLLLICLLFLGTMNALVTRQYEAQPHKVLEGIIQNNQRPEIANKRTQLLERFEEERDLEELLINEFRKQDLRRIRLLSLYSLIPIAVLSVVGGYVIAGSMLAPIQRVIQATKVITHKDLKQQIPNSDTQDEIHDLIRNFNKMIVRLDHAFDAQTQFIENASHELKTPLTVIQTNIEAAESTKKKSKKKQYLEQARQSTIKLNQLLEDLLLMALMEQHVHKKRLSLDQLLSDIERDARIIANEEGVQIVLSNTIQDAAIRGNENLLYRAVMNVIENAIRYSKNGQTVEVYVEQQGGEAHVRVKDYGPGIPTQDHQRMFQRFERGTNTGNTQGAGIGLAITQNILALHDGEITIEKSDANGTTFTIALPVLA